MGSGGSSTTVQKADPWIHAQPNLLHGLAVTRNLLDKDALVPKTYEGDRIAGFGDVTQAAQGGILNTALGQQGSLDAAHQGVSDMASGDNIYRDLDAVKKSALEGIMPNVMASFGGQGMQDSSTARQEAATAAATAIAPIEYGAYNRSQDRALQASALLPELSRAQYMPSQMIGQVGQSQDAMRQQQIDADMAKYYEEASRRSRALGRFSDLSLGYGGQGGTQSSTGPDGSPSTGSQIAGAGLGGLGAYGALASNPITAPFAIGGGLLAGLGSLF